MRKRLALLGISILFAACSTTSNRVRLVQYHIEPGDNLSRVAARLNVSEDELRTLNELKSNSLSKRAFILVPDRGQRALRGFKPPEDDFIGAPPPAIKAARAVSKVTSTGRTVSLGNAREHIGRLERPLGAGVLRSRFGPRGNSFHEGLDVCAKEGTPILAAHDGIVAFSGEKLRGYGKIVILKGNGIVTVYAHASSLDVRSGEIVQGGDKIAEVGQTGHATAPHLHFEVRLKDDAGRYAAVDPLKFFPDGIS